MIRWRLVAWRSSGDGLAEVDRGDGGPQPVPKVGKHVAVAHPGVFRPLCLPSSLDAPPSHDNFESANKDYRRPKAIKWRMPISCGHQSNVKI